MTTAAAKECVRRDPKMLGQSVKDKLRPKFEYLVEHAGLRPGNVGDMLWLDLETQIKPRVEFLALECGMGSTAAAAAIRNFPPSQSHVLYRHFENPENMARKALKCLREKVGMSAEQVSFAIGRFPKILDYSPEKIAGCFEFCARRARREECRRVIAATPQVVGLSVEENMAPSIVCWRTSWASGKTARGGHRLLSKPVDRPKTHSSAIHVFLETVGCCENLTAMLASHPHGVLSLSTDNILESMNFIENVFATLPWTTHSAGRSAAVADLRLVLAKVPMLLGYSVERKMRPTVDYADAPGRVRVSGAEEEHQLARLDDHAEVLYLGASGLERFAGDGGSHEQVEVLREGWHHRRRVRREGGGVHRAHGTDAPAAGQAADPRVRHQIRHQGPDKADDVRSAGKRRRGRDGATTRDAEEAAEARRRAAATSRPTANSIVWGVYAAADARLSAWGLPYP